MDLREAAPGDVDGIQRLLRAGNLPARGVQIEGGTWIAAVEEGALLGVAGLDPAGSALMLRSVAVVPARRGQGVARRLVEALLARAAAGGGHAVFLLTTDAAGYFERFGFGAVPRETAPAGVRDHPQFRELCPASATLMRLERPEG